MRRITLSAIIPAGIAVLSLCPRVATPAPTAVEPGWAVHKVADGFESPTGLYYDPASTHLFVADGDIVPHARIYRVTLVGVKTLIHSADDEQARYMAFDPATRRVSFGNGQGDFPIWEIDEFGAPLGTLVLPGASFLGMAYAPDGFLYVNEGVNLDLMRYDPGTSSFVTVAASVCGGSSLMANLELAFDAGGNAYISCDDLVKVPPGGSATPIPTGIYPRSTACGDGSLFVVEDEGGSSAPRIWRVAPDGSSRTLFASGHLYAFGLWYGANGNLYASDYLDGSVWEYSRRPVSAPSAGAGDFAFAPPSPNPARTGVVLRISLPREARVALTVYDVSGARVRTLVRGVRSAGDHPIAWDLRSDRGERVPAGLYFVNFECAGRSLVRRVATTE